MWGGGEGRGVSTQIKGGGSGTIFLKLQCILISII